MCASASRYLSTLLRHQALKSWLPRFKQLYGLSAVDIPHIYAHYEHLGTVAMHDICKTKGLLCNLWYSFNGSSCHLCLLLCVWIRWSEVNSCGGFDGE